MTVHGLSEYMSTDAVHVFKSYTGDSSVLESVVSEGFSLWRGSLRRASREGSFTGDHGLSKEGSGDRHLFMGAQLGNLEWARLLGTLEMAKRGSGGAASLTMAALWGGPGGSNPLLGTLDDRQKRLWRWASLSIGAPLRNLDGAHLPGPLRDGWRGLHEWSVSVPFCVALNNLTKRLSFTEYSYYTGALG
jgi:hypothetical protein